MFVSKSFVVQDCYYFDPQTTDKNRYTVDSGSASITYSSDGVTIRGTATSDCYVRNNALTLPDEYEATFEITGLEDTVSTGNNKYYGGLCFDNWFTDWANPSNYGYTYKLSPITQLSSGLGSPSVGTTIKVVRENGSMNLYYNDVLKATNNNISHTGYFQHRSYNGRTITVKNLKIKPL